MATGYEVSGRGDLDALFKPRVSAAGANTGFRSNGGVDLAQRFEPRGASPAISATNYKAGANDLAQLFMNIAAAGDLITASSITAGANSTRAGYSAGSTGTGLVAFGSMSPTGVGPWFVENAFYNSASDCEITWRGSGVAPADTDQNFKSATFTGIFGDSGGVSVARTVTRAARASTFTNSSGGTFFRTWTYATTAFRFISGNTYAVSIARAP